MATSDLVINQVKERFLCLSPTVQGKQEREACTTDFEKIYFLGQGAFGKVYKVRHKLSKKIYTLKQIQKKQIQMQNMVPIVLNEVRIMYNLDHPNIIKLYNHFEEEDYIYLVYECASGGQLYHKLNKVGKFDERTVKQYMIDIMSAIEYLHTRNPPIIHRDIKPENIFIDADGKVKLADFGWSNINNHQRKTYCGTLDYFAPEMIIEADHDEKVDLWSLGVLIFELLTGKAPFAPNQNVKDPKEQQRQLEENILQVRLNFPPDFPTLAKSLITGLLNKDPSKRFTVQTMKEHPWLSDCSMNQQIQSEQNFNHQKIKDIPKDDSGQFRQEAIAQVMNRQLNQDDKDDQDERKETKKRREILRVKQLDLTKEQFEQKMEKIEEKEFISYNGEEPGVCDVYIRELKLLKEQKQKLDANFVGSQAEIKYKEAEIQSLNEELQKMSEMQKQRDEAQVLLQEKLKKNKSLIEELDANFVRSQAEIKNKEAEIKRLNENLQKMSQMQKQRDEAQVLLQEKIKENELLSSYIKEQGKFNFDYVKVKELQKEVQTIQTKFRTLSEKEEKNEAEIKRLNENLQKMSQMQKQRDEAQILLQEKINENKYLSSSIEELQSQFEWLLYSVKKKDIEIKRLNENLQNITDQQNLSDMQKQRDEAQVLLQEKIKENELLSSFIKDQGGINFDYITLKLLEEKVQIVQTKFRRLSEKEEEKEAEIKRLNENLQKMTDMQIQRFKAQRLIQGNINKNIYLKSSIEDLQSYFEWLSDSIEKKDIEIKRLNEDLQKFTDMQNLSDMQKIIDEAKVLLQEKIKENKLLSSIIEEKGLCNVDYSQLRHLEEENQQLKDKNQILLKKAKYKDDEIKRLNGELQKMINIENQNDQLNHLAFEMFKSEMSLDEAEEKFLTLNNAKKLIKEQRLDIQLLKKKLLELTEKEKNQELRFKKEK